MSATIRQEAVRAISTAHHKLDHVDFKTTHLKELFGADVFNETVHITWPGQRASEFTFEWLGRHSYGINHLEVSEDSCGAEVHSLTVFVSQVRWMTAYATN